MFRRPEALRPDAPTTGRMRSWRARRRRPTCASPPSPTPLQTWQQRWRRTTQRHNTAPDCQSGYETTAAGLRAQPPGSAPQPPAQRGHSVAL